MDFGTIKREPKEIEMEEWQSVIDKKPYLLQMESKTGINPFTGEEVLFHRKHGAYYIEGEEKIGNVALEQGALLTTGVPVAICTELASELGGIFQEDDRS